MCTLLAPRAFLSALPLMLMLLLAAIPTTINSLPPPQLPMTAPKSLNQQRPFLSLNVLQGDDVQSLLHQIASGLNQGYPNNWERLTRPPSTQGNSDIQTIAPLDLESTIRTWGLHADMFDKAYNDINTLIRVAVEQGVYIAQGFSYNLPQGCQGGGPHPACLSTLVAVVRVPHAADGQALMAEVGHFYMTTTAETVQQYEPTHTCHRCWFKTCCHDGKKERPISVQELLDVKQVMSTFQFQWAMDHVSQYVTELDIAVAPQPSCLDTNVSTVPLWPSKIENLVRRFISNSRENKDVHKTHKGGLLEAIQNATLSRRQSFHNMQLTIGEANAVPLLEDLLSSCFLRSGVDETVEEWWNRVRTSPDGQRGDPISLECEFASQEKVAVVPPRRGCVTSTNVTVDNSYSWVLVAPLGGGLLDVVFMEGDLGVTFDECVPEESQDPDCPMHMLPSDNNNNNKVSGSMVRWAFVDPEDGSFRSTQYLAEWSIYPSYVSKVLLDILRYGSAMSYLKIPVYNKPQSAHFQQYQQDPDSVVVAPLANSLSFMAMMDAINKFAEGWEKLAKAIGSSSTTTVKRRVCLGFDQLDYKATSSVMQGVSIKNLPLLVEDVVDLEALPNRDDIKRLMTGVKYSTNFTWMAESMTFTNPAGEQSYMFFAKYGDAVTEMADVVYSAIKSKFVIAKDMLIVRRQKSGILGFGRSDETSIEYIPHTMTLNDTLILEMFWEMIAFHQLAISLGGQPPKYPDLSGLCDRSIP
ncbi:MAG: hypothetical protein J3R72DRAFT_477205 [Linnemannia gamsii]|nr:MAG: hypothetical protein J3R72DRAFT_477205 [Linnemannia gamsii]